MEKQEPNKVVQYWLDEIRLAKKREKDYRKVGVEVMKIYEADDEQLVPFNILYSNTETLRPALFSAQPRPVVMRRFKDDDPIGKMASDAGRRMLEFLLDTNREGYETVVEAMGAGVMDALLPGRGLITLKYEADFVEIPEARPPDESDTPKIETEPVEYAENETICPESIIWDRVFFGYAKKWHNVPWIAYEHFLTKEEVATKFGKSIAEELKYTTAQASAENDDEKREKTKDDEGARKTACVYQIWDKAGGRKIIHVASSYPDAILKEEDDPLGLTGFFNTPRPLMFIEKSSSLVPTAPYKMYKNQAQELNRLTRRINKIIEAIKARGIYDGSLGDQLAKIMEQDDNTLIAADTASSLATEKGFQNAIWFIPIEQLIAVLVQLYQAREACKQVIYEITGISDILRGATQASETATAQQIKNQWGTLRLKRMQQEVARYLRDLLRMMLELAATKFSEETWSGITGLPFTTSQQRQQLEMQAQVLTMQGQPIPPQLQQQLAQPVWTQILELLRDDLSRSYRIDIETNSTVEPEATEDQKAISDLLGMLGQYLNGVGPLIAKGVLPFQAAQSMMLAISRRFRFGQEIEDSLKQMQPPKQEDDGKGQEAVKQQMEMAQQQLALKQKEAEGAVQMKQMDAEMQAKQKEMDLQMREAQLKVEQEVFALQQQMAQEKLALRDQVFQQKTVTEEKVRQVKDRSLQREQQFSKQADGKVTQSVSALTQTAQQVQQLGEALQQIQQQASETQEVLAALLKAATAKRVKRAIRGADQRIERVEEEIVA